MALSGLSALLLATAGGLWLSTRGGGDRVRQRAIAVGAWCGDNNYWGGGFGWGNNNINQPTDNIERPNWTYNRVDHRGGVRYNNVAVQQNSPAAIAAGRRTTAWTSAAAMASR